MKKYVVSAFVLSLFLLNSCFYIRVDYPGEWGRAPLDDFHENVPFSPGSTLSLENVNGNVEIHGWEREELEVYAEKMVQLPDRTRFYFYPKRDIGPGIVFDKFENFVKIKTKSISEEAEAGFVDYYIDLPRSVNLKDIVVRKGNIIINRVYGDAYVDLTEGDIVVDNYSGSLTASVVSGTVDASLFDLRDEDEIVITSREGDIVLSLQADAAARIEAVFPNGEIRTEFELQIPAEEKKIDARLGENGPHIALTALRGDVTIKKILND